MAPLSNAERQARWQAKHKARFAELEAEVERLKAGYAPAVNADLAKQLEPHLESLFDQGTRNIVTMSPASVMASIVRLERILVTHGIVPDSERTRDAAKYAAKLRRRMDQHVAKAVEMSAAAHKEKAADRMATGQDIPPPPPPSATIKETRAWGKRYGRQWWEALKAQAAGKAKQSRDDKLRVLKLKVAALHPDWGGPGGEEFAKAKAEYDRARAT
jgi:hypothetical protein